MDHLNGILQPTSTLPTQLKTLENSFAQARLAAERVLHKYSRHPWSPKMRQAQLQVLYYKLWLSQYKTGNDYTTQHNRLNLKDVHAPDSKQATQRLLRQAQNQLRQVKLQATLLREQHLEDRVLLANIQGDLRKAQAIRAIKTAEAF